MVIALAVPVDTPSTTIPYASSSITTSFNHYIPTIIPTTLTILIITILVILWCSLPRAIHSRVQTVHLQKPRCVKRCIQALAMGRAILQ